MSLCNIFLQPSAGFLMSDAGVWGSGRTLIDLRTKLVAYPKIRAAMVCRGLAGLEALGQHAHRFSSQAELLAHLPEYAAKLKRHYQQHVSDNVDRDVEVTLVLWEEKASHPIALQLNTAEPTDQLQGYSAVAHREGRYCACEWFDLPALVLAPSITGWFGHWPSLHHLGNERRFDVRKVAAQVVGAQRSVDRSAEGWAVPTVAGWVDMAVVTAEGVTVERIITWQDDGRHGTA